MRQVTAFSCFSHTPTHACARNSRTTLCFKTCKSFYQTNSHVGFPNLASDRLNSDFWTRHHDFPSSLEFECTGARKHNKLTLESWKTEVINMENLKL
mgnify:CR=1 FL=1